MDMGNGVCEMRRLYVKPQYRKSGIGKILTKAIIEQGRNIGYTSMRLNTNKKMTGAEELYRSLGFKDIAPYENFEVDNMVFLELKLI
jgi:ribosomal protein S18 acetylase RimI-like enzyme